jgi:hypothetical protein
MSNGALLGGIICFLIFTIFACIYSVNKWLDEQEALQSQASRTHVNESTSSTANMSESSDIQDSVSNAV